MNSKSMQTYSAFIYEVENRFMADCSLLNLVSSGVTPHEAVENLKNQINTSFRTENFQINPVFERR